jgi:methylase of polypeptide subunit release factors
MSFLAFCRWTRELAQRLQSAAAAIAPSDAPPECLRCAQPVERWLLASIIATIVQRVDRGPVTIGASNPTERDVAQWLERANLQSNPAIDELHRWLEQRCASADFVRGVDGLKRHHGTQRPGVYVLEHILQSLNPRARVQANMYATPKAVADFMVQHLAQQMTPSQRDAAVLIDPAAGSGALIQAAVVSGRFSPAQMFAIECDPAAHSAATAILCASAGLDRSQVILADALAHSTGQHLMNTDNRPLVIVANPPFVATAGHTRFALHDDALRDPSLTHRPVDGELLGKNTKWLSSLSLQFLQWIQLQCANARARNVPAFLAIALNRALIEQPTFATVRRALRRLFSDIEVVDLHGVARQGLRTPEDHRDQSVFEIQQGVCLLLAHTGDRALATVRRADLWGTRQSKLGALATGSLVFQSLAGSPEAAGAAWIAGAPQRDDTALAQPSAHAIDDDERLWRAGFSLSDAYERLCPAPITGRDKFAIARTHALAQERIAWLADLSVQDDSIRSALLTASDTIDLHRVRNAARAGELRVEPWAYRAFDQRHVLAHPLVLQRARDPSIMGALSTAKTLAIVTRRQSPPERPWSYLLVVNKPASDGVLRADPQGTEVLIARDRLSTDGSLERNGRREWLAQLGAKMGYSHAHSETETFADLAFAYCVGVMSSHRYRTVNQRWLCSELPRISWPMDQEQFARVAMSGQAVIEAHTRAAHRAAAGQWSFDRDAGAMIETVTFVAHPSSDQGVVRLGPSFVLRGITRELWNFTLGARRPLARWLQDRQGTELSADELQDFLRICEQTHDTMALWQKSHA